jgi:hypothetical protein
MATLFQITGPHPYKIEYQGIKGKVSSLVENTPYNVGKPYKNKNRAKARCERLNIEYGRDVYYVERVES